ncbi:LSU ribosomal protein L13P [Salpingoeca rosetta]|uniref:LSU ribosomal protein L13P n=1 Tax=Salpingoeca rosetta (strain ATCC 50818 / BSB-021) TaxID=946362 RepID=F2USG1_SALR5|nr:LSU ribosomal protein L13P [Salpingoeca rosetta]EGD81070.1 LSU ribosomal protein L13P [Salpingoeca rosetta]|eukprot:XP_004987939.1 LSU ribosomal protein L13P [Salpingoeca rosetta]
MATKFSQSLLTHTQRWYLVDARGQKVGRLANMVSAVLRGKTKPTFHPGVLSPDHVVVINAKDVVFTGRKWNQKLYRKHTGWPGGFREETAASLHARKPTEVVRKAVDGMLPKNNLRKQFMRHLHIFEDDQHPYDRNIYAVLDGPQEPVPPKPDLFVIRTVEGDEEIPAPAGGEFLGVELDFTSGSSSGDANDSSK